MKQSLEESSFAFDTPERHSDYLELLSCETEVCIASKMKLWDVLRMWGWYLGICSICTKFEADLCVFPAKFAKTRKLNQTFAYNDNFHHWAANIIKRPYLVSWCLSLSFSSLPRTRPSALSHISSHIDFLRNFKYISHKAPRHTIGSRIKGYALLLG